MKPSLNLSAAGVFLAVLATLGILNRAALADPAEPPARRWLVTAAGAAGDGQTLNTAAIQSAIDQCAGGGGGVVVVPAGVFMSGALFFKPGVSLLVEKDGVLKGSASPNDYPQVNTRWEGVERRWTSAFLNFDNATNVQLSGEGTVDGSGDLWMQRSGYAPRRRSADTNAPAAAVAPRPASPGLRAGRPRMICFTRCRAIRISGLHLQRQAVWCLHLLYCQDVVVSNLTIRAIERIPSSDGIDVDSCDGVDISHCDIACNDDDIAIKSGKDADGLRVNRPSQNIIISDCEIGAGAGIAMGSEVSGSIRHVLVQRCRFTGSGAAARFKSQPSRGGVIEDIVFRDIQLNHPRLAVECNLEWRMVPPIAPPASVLTVMRNVRLINFTGAADSGGVLDGLPGSPVDGVKFENCHLTARRGLVLQNVTNLDLAGLDLKVTEGDPIIRR